MSPKRTVYAVTASRRVLETQRGPGGSAVGTRRRRVRGEVMVFGSQPLFLDELPKVLADDKDLVVREVNAKEAGSITRLPKPPKQESPPDLPDLPISVAQLRQLAKILDLDPAGDKKGLVKRLHEENSRLRGEGNQHIFTEALKQTE